MRLRLVGTWGRDAILAAAIALSSAAHTQTVHVACPASATPTMPDLRGPLNAAIEVVRARFPKNPSQTDLSAATSGVVARQQPPPCAPITPSTPILLLGPPPAAAARPEFRVEPPATLSSTVKNFGGAPAYKAYAPATVLIAPAAASTANQIAMRETDDAAAAPARSSDSTASGSPATPAVNPQSDAPAASSPAKSTPLPVVYQRQQVMKVGESSVYRVVIASGDLNAALARVGAQGGQPSQQTASIGSVARANLEGDANAVDISRASEADQIVTPGQNAEWVWNIRPKLPGKVILTLSVYNLVSTSVGTQPSASLAALSDEITVQSTPGFWLPKLGSLWTALFGGGGIIVIIAGWFGWKRASGGKGK